MRKISVMITVLITAMAISLFVLSAITASAEEVEKPLARPTVSIVNGGASDGLIVKWTYDSDYNEETDSFQMAFRVRNSGEKYSYVENIPITEREIKIPNLKCGSLYEIQLRAYRISSDGTLYGEWSRNRTMTFLVAPEISVKSVPTGIRISWDEVYGANEYQVARLINGKWTQLSITAGQRISGNSGKLSYNDNKVTDNEFYQYRILARKNESATSIARSYVSNEITAQFQRVYVGNTKLSATTKDTSKGTFSLNWGQASNATGYRIYRKTYYTSSNAVKSDWKYIKTAHGTSYVFSYPPNGEIYQFEVHPVYTENGSVCSSNKALSEQITAYTSCLSTDEAKVYYYFTSKGFNKAATCGVMANIMAECAFNPYWYFAEYVPDAEGAPGNSGGICMWYDDNCYRFRRDCPNWNKSIDAQIEYLYQTIVKNDKGGLRPSDKYYYAATGIYTMLKSTPNSESGARSAAYKFCRNYENPSWGSETARQNFASEYWYIVKSL